MTVTEQMYAFMASGVGVTALVPASRIKPNGDWQALTRPYIVHFGVSLEPTQLHDGLASMQIWRPYQVSVFADSLSSATAIAEALKALMGHANYNGMQTMLSGEQTMAYEFDTETQQIVLEFDVFTA